MSCGGTVEVCHIETSAGEKGRLEREKRGGKRRGAVNGNANLKKYNTGSIADETFGDLKSEEEADEVQECLPGKKRKSQIGGEEYRPQKKGRTE